MSGQYASGLEGERLAEAHLQSLGFKVIARRTRSRHGEIDLIASKGKLLYFVEVKYRPEGRLGCGLLSITAEKRRRLMDAAREYLKGDPRPWRLAYLEITRAGILFREDIAHEQ